MHIEMIKNNPFGPLSSQTLEDFESDYHISLSADYRAFLLKYNGGQPSPSFFWIQAQKDGTVVNQFYGLHDGPMHLNLRTYIDKGLFGSNKSLLAIGDDGLGNFICIGISPHNRGEIFFVDHDLFHFYEPNSCIGITRISRRFHDFFNSLTTPPEE